ncbi:flagellar motor protein MotB [Paenalcaligenes faecalis]|uniref:flagellar motor protein MotB n=1 Tax=Paenalcaligenes faecalis TaxID=2980099 RepID=UPI0022B9421D|nr:flagellar motor protein MotB [Paenalcaligenes faecalis]
MSKDNIIVVRRKGKRGKERHGGSWKIAYADFMTAMMAFFLVMWILTLIPKEELKEIADYFRMPLLEAVSGGMRAEHSTSVIPGGEPSIIPNPNAAAGGVENDGHARDMSRLEDLKFELETLIQSDPNLREFHPQLLLDMTQDGLRIQIIDKQNRPMFAMGSASVQSYMRTILRALSGLLNEMPNRLQIAGYTDSFQYASGEREYSNWELSADRANAARKELVAGGLAEDKIKQILGLSSTVSLIKDNPAAAVNRRISITVLSRQAEERIDAQNESGRTNHDLSDLYDQDTTMIPSSPTPTQGLSLQEMEAVQSITNDGIDRDVHDAAQSTN